MILAERKREAAAEALGAEDASQTVLNCWFEKRLVFPVLYEVASNNFDVPASYGSARCVF